MDAAALLESYYNAINKQDTTAIADFLAHDVIYDDLAVLSDSLEGPDAVITFFTQVFENAGPNLSFVIDDITQNDNACVGVLWHLENQGIVPLGKGCSFYRLAERNGSLKIIYGREVREPTVKSTPGGDLTA